MHLTPAKIIVVALLVVAFGALPDKCKPGWSYRTSWWQVLIGMVAGIFALLIIMNPELLALGVLGDATFIDLLVLAIGIPMQGIFSRTGVYLLAQGTRILRFVRWRYRIASTVLTFCILDALLTVQQSAGALLWQRH